MCVFLSRLHVLSLHPQDYESKLLALQKQVETRSLTAETTEEEDEEEEEGKHLSQSWLHRNMFD